MANCYKEVYEYAKRLSLQKTADSSIGILGHAATIGEWNAAISDDEKQVVLTVIAGHDKNEFLDLATRRSKDLMGTMDVVILDRALTQFFTDTESADSLRLVLIAMFTLLKSDGFALVREDLSSSGNKSLASLSGFFDNFNATVTLQRECDDLYVVEFKLDWMKSLKSAIIENGNWQDLCWCLQKSILCKKDKQDSKDKFDNKETASARETLDSHQYSKQAIQAFEYIFGEGFISPGGAEENKRLLDELHLGPNEYMLDVGCGIGGNAFQASKNYGCNVLGLDLSSNMIETAIERASKAGNTQLWLKAGGVVFLTDYNTGEIEERSQLFNDYLEERQYKLATISEYEKVIFLILTGRRYLALKEAGFTDVESEDMTLRLQTNTKNELKKVESMKEVALQVYGLEKYEMLVSAWRAKLNSMASGELKWGKFKAVKR